MGDNAIGEISLTRGAGGLLNQWGDHSILGPHFVGGSLFKATIIVAIFTPRRGASDFELFISIRTAMMQA